MPILLQMLAFWRPCHVTLNHDCPSNSLQSTPSLWLSPVILMHYKFAQFNCIYPDKHGSRPICSELLFLSCLEQLELTSSVWFLAFFLTLVQHRFLSAFPVAVVKTYPVCILN